MRLSYSICRTETALQVKLLGTTAPVYSPHIEGLIYANEESLMEGEPATILLSTSIYPTPSGELLPPLLLIEPADDPETAEAQYAEYGGYCYIGQFLLPDDSLGEVAEVTITRKALSLWQDLFQQSTRHTQAYRKHQADVAALFQLAEPAQIQGALSLSKGDQDCIDACCQMLQEAADGGHRLAALEQLKLVEPLRRPLSALLPCLDDPIEAVRDQALQLLKPLASQLPEELLERIVDCGPLQTRLAAIALLAASGGKNAEEVLLVTRWRRHAWIRMAALGGLVELDAHRSEVLAALSTALREDGVPAVRAYAAQLFEKLGDTGGVLPLQTALQDERELSVRQAIVRAISTLERQVVGYGAIREVMTGGGDGDDVWFYFHTDCFSLLRQWVPYEITQEITYQAATCEEYVCDSCAGALELPPLSHGQRQEVLSGKDQLSQIGQQDSIPATIVPDDCPGVIFDARQWLREASDGDVLALRDDGYAGRAGDGAAQFMRSYDGRVEAVLAYCEAVNAGYRCSLDAQKVEAWMKRYRPHLCLSPQQ